MTILKPLTSYSMISLPFCLLLGSWDKTCGFTIAPTSTMSTVVFTDEHHSGILHVSRRRSRHPLHSVRHADDAEENATPLDLSTADLERFQACKTRQKTMPLLILDSMVPKQELSFESSDPKLIKLVQYCLENDSDAVMVGTNPTTGSALSRGVTISVDARNIHLQPSRQSMVLSVKAERRVEIQSQPWLDDSGEFYLADIELIDDVLEPTLTPEQNKKAQQLYDTLPTAMDEWSDFVLKSGATDEKGLESRLDALGPMPTEMTERAFWVAAAINPLPTLGVCLEIRPAMLCCTNDYERMVLACQAVQSSIDHVSGKRRLF